MIRIGRRLCRPRLRKFLFRGRKSIDRRRSTYGFGSGLEDVSIRLSFQSIKILTFVLPFLGLVRLDQFLT